MIKGFHHTNLVVSDMEKTKEFYTEVLGLEIELEKSIDGGELSRGVDLPDTRVKVVLFSVPGSGTLVEAFQYVHPPGRPIPSDSKPNDKGFGHICFEVTDIEDAYRELLQKGVEFVSSPVTLANGVRWCYFYGPDREFLEVLQLPSETA